MIEKALTTIAVVALIAAVYVLALPRGTDQPDTMTYPQVRHGVDSVLAVVVSSTCPACSDPTTVSSVDSLLHRIADERPRESRLRLLGVTVDVDPNSGLSFLQRLGPFDEIAAGGGWGNLVFTDLVWNDTLGVAAVPQLVLLTREFEIVDDHYHQTGETIQPLAVGKDKVIDRLASFLGS